MNTPNRLFAVALLGALCGCAEVKSEYAAGRGRWPFILDGDQSLLSPAEISRVFIVATQQIGRNPSHMKIIRIRVISARKVEAFYGTGRKSDEAYEVYLVLQRKRGDWRVTGPPMWAH